MLLVLSIWYLAIYCWLFLSVLFHELGHFLVARLLKLNPTHIKIGSGSSLPAFTIGSTTIEIQVVPLGGMVQCNTLLHMISTFQRVLLYSAGPIANLIMLVLMIWLHEHYKEYNYPAIYQNISGVLIWLEAIFILFNLWPAKSIPPYTDGRQIYLSLRYPGKKYQTKVLAPLLLTNHAQGDQTLDATREAFSGELDIFDALEKRQKAIDGKDFDKAANICEAALKTADLRAIERAYLVDLYASLVINHGQMKFRDRAEVLVDEVRKELPSNKTLMGTKGALLVEKGRYESASVFLSPLLAEGNTLIDQQISAAYLAKAAFELGEEDVARAHLESISGKPPELHFLDELKKALDKAGPGESASNELAGAK